MRTNVYMTKAAFDMLPEYSASYPTGQFIGKQWKCCRRQKGKLDIWLLAEYIPDDDPKYIGLDWKNIIVSVSGLKPDRFCNPNDWVRLYREAKEKGEAHAH